jgi:hypothetical protein
MRIREPATYPPIPLAWTEPGFMPAPMAILALAPLVARDTLVGGATIYGFLLGDIGLGAVAGAVSSGWLRSRLLKETAIRFYAAALVTPVAVVAFSPWKPVSFSALLVVGACWLFTISTCNIAAQLSSPSWVVGGPCR